MSAIVQHVGRGNGPEAGASLNRGSRVRDAYSALIMLETGTRPVFDVKVPHTIHEHDPC